MAAEIENEITDLLSSGNRALLLIGKIEKKTSLEVMKIVKKLDDEKEADLFFAYHEEFKNARDYLLAIVNDIKTQYVENRSTIDPDNMLENLFNTDYASSIRSEPINSFTAFATSMAAHLKTAINNIVFYLDPEKISDFKVFNKMLNDIIFKLPPSIKLVIYEETEGSKNAPELMKRNDVKKFVIPSTPLEAIQYFEMLIANGKIEQDKLPGYQALLGDLYAIVGKESTSKEYYDRAITGMLNKEKYSDACQVMIRLAINYYTKQDIKNTLLTYETAADISTNHDIYPISIFVRTEQARIEMNLGNTSSAENYCNLALEMAEKGQDIGGKVNIISLKGDINMKANKLDWAENFYNVALELERSNENHYGMARELQKLSELYTRRGKMQEAEKYKKESLQIQKEKNFSLSVDPKESAKKTSP